MYTSEYWGLSKLLTTTLSRNVLDLMIDFGANTVHHAMFGRGLTHLAATKSIFLEEKVK